MGLLDGTTQQEYYNGNDFGNYQFVSLDTIIDQFLISYVGEDKIIPKIKTAETCPILPTLLGIMFELKLRYINIMAAEYNVTPVEAFNGFVILNLFP